MTPRRPGALEWGRLYLRLTAVVLGTLVLFGVTMVVLHSMALGRATRPLRLEMIRATADEAARQPQDTRPHEPASAVRTALLAADGSLLAGDPLPSWIQRQMKGRPPGEFCSAWFGPCYALRRLSLRGGDGTLVVYSRAAPAALGPLTVAFLASVVVWLLVSAAAGMLLLSALRSADEARGRLLAGLAHDLGTPLTSIRGFAETQLASPPGSAGESARGWTIVYREALRMQRLVEDMLAASRLSAGRLALVKQPFDARVALQAAAECGALAHPRPPTVSVPGQAVLLNADRDRIDQVLANLVDNAYRHGGGDVALALREQEGQVVLTVTDQGPGLPEPARAALFERYRRGPTLAGGSGLGLAVAREIATRHGGRLTLEDAPGGGCQAVLVLPLGV